MLPNDCYVPFFFPHSSTIFRASSFPHVNPGSYSKSSMHASFALVYLLAFLSSPYPVIVFASSAVTCFIAFFLRSSFSALSFFQKEDLGNEENVFERVRGAGG